MNALDLDQSTYDLSLDTLKKGSIFGALSDEAIEFLLTHSQLQEYEAEEQVYAEGSEADGFFIVLYGSINLYKPSSKIEKADEREIDFSDIRIRFGENLGYIAMIALAPRSVEARAAETSVLMKIDWFTLHALHETYPFDFGIMILNLSRDISRTIHKLANTLAANGISLVTCSRGKIT